MAWGVLLLFYYQQVIGVEAALVGLAIAIAVMIDAVTDPLIGLGQTASALVGVAVIRCC